MEKECSNGCFVELPCQKHKFDKKEDCPSWKEANKELVDKKGSEDIGTTDGYRVAWTSNSLGIKNLPLIGERSCPIIIGVIGLSNSGKTTFLSLIYLMLISGKKIGEWSFVNSYTMRGWENIVHGLKWSPGNSYQFPPHTSVNDGRANGLLHLALRNDSDTKDIVFTDVAGEWFANWSKDKYAENSTGALWVQDNSDGFILLTDSDKLASTNGQERAEGISGTLALLDLSLIHI